MAGKAPPQQAMLAPGNIETLTVFSTYKLPGYFNHGD